MISVCLVSSSSTAITISPGDKFSENDVSDLVKMGFKRDEVITELRRNNGNKNQAIAELLAKTYRF